MSNLFSASEIIEIGMQIEENGRDFYNTLINQSQNQKAKSIFKFLAEEEEKHIVVFQKLLDSTEKYGQTDSYPGEYLSYMNALASDYVFSQKDKGIKVAKDTKSDKEAVELGIGFEKDSIIFYEGMKKVVLEKEYRAIDELIRQEQNHLLKLSELKNELR